MCAGSRHACPCLCSYRFPSRLFETSCGDRAYCQLRSFAFVSAWLSNGLSFLTVPGRGGIPLFTKNIFARVIPAAIFAVLLCVAHTSAQTKLLRFPDIHGDRVAFTYGGDIWTAPAKGGTATRLTAHPGIEVFAKFSPDGNWIAFTGQYDGDEQVYVIPATGGVPKQLTFYPAKGPLTPRWGWDNQVYGWSKDGQRIIFRSMRDSWTLGDSRLYTVSVSGGMPEALPMPKSGAGDFSPDGSKVVYSPLFRDFRTWKRYEGGWAQQLYIFDLESHAAEKISEDPRVQRDPMWIGSKIFYSSDRDGTNNLYSYDPSRKK